MTDIICYDGQYFIRINDTIPTWQSGFDCEEAAQHFIDTHDILSATEEHIRYSDEDLQYVIDTYGFRPDKDLYVARAGSNVISLKPYEDTIQLNVQNQKESSAYEFDSISELTGQLDKYFETNIYASKKLQDKFFIFAASAREIAKNMVRVKSSNIWSYTMNVRSNKDNTGDVYVQYKNKNGGPGDVYVYYNVPIKLWRRWLSAPSKGHFMWQFIRNTFLYAKLTGDKKTHLPNGISAQQAKQMQSQVENDKYALDDE